MTAIFSSSALKTRQREIKDIADDELVHITENGNGAYIFCSEDVFSRELQKAYDQALYDIELRDAITRAEEDIAHGRISTSMDEARAKLDSIRKSNA